MFHKRSRAKDGLTSYCAACKKIADAKRREDPNVRAKQIEFNRGNRNRLRQLLYTYMKDKSCITCGENDNACLQFDHRDGVDKKFNISDAPNQAIGWSIILLEIDKCDILCANCHHKRTAIQQGWYEGLE